MFAIQNPAGKFVNPKFFLDANKVFDVTVSAKPATVKTHEQAERRKTLLDEYYSKIVARCIENEQIQRKNIKRYSAQFENLTADIGELQDRPYRDVKDVMPKLEDKLARCKRNIVDCKRAQTENARIRAQTEKVINAGYTVVEVDTQLTVKAVA